jgi:hypothetical protein
MTDKRVRSLAAGLFAVALLGQPLQARAEIVSTEQITSQQRSDAERARVQSFVERADAAGQLHALGVAGPAARARIAALSDDEVHALAGRIDTLPAGGNFGSFTDEQVIIVLLLIILVAVLV